jgi:uncharacterized membrane protein
MKNTILLIPIMTVLLNIAVLTQTSILREAIAFSYLSFVPGYAILKMLKLREIGPLNSFLLSVGLSITASMFVGLLINQILPVMGFSRPLSIVPLTAAISIFTIIVFFLAYNRKSAVNDVQELDITSKLSKNSVPLAIVLITLPILSAIGALYVNIPLMIILFVSICSLIVLSIVTNKIIPSTAYPFLILSISISLLFLSLLISRYAIGDDVNLEYYVFRMTQNNGYWGPINSVTHSYSELNYNSMLSVTILPTIYSILMDAKDGIFFKILYSFILSLIPLTLYSIYKKETSKWIALLSTLFFVFSINAFFGELTSLNRQIIAEFFLVLSIFLWLEKTLPTREKRILLFVFGVSLGVSHYAIALIYLVFVSLVVLISSIKPKFDFVFTAPLVLSIFGATILFYLFSYGSLLDSIINTARAIVAELANFNFGLGAGSFGAVTALPGVFTVASWINLAVSGIVYVLLAVGVLAAILLSRRNEVSGAFTFVLVSGAFIFAVSIGFPAVAAALNFTRFYAISFLLLSPCLVIGALSLLNAIHISPRNSKESQKSGISFLKKQKKTSMVIVVALLVVYLLSQSGFVNYVTGGAIHSQTFDYHRMEKSSTLQTSIQFYEIYIQPQDSFSAVWLSKHANLSSLLVYSDGVSQAHVLTSEGLIPWELIKPLTNDTQLTKGSFVYLDRLAIEKDVVIGSDQNFKTSEITSAFNSSNVIYSNGGSEVWSAPSPG